MPVTKGQGNPTWTREETILALDLLYRRGALDRHHPDVIELSEFLRGASFVAATDRRPNFRNPDGVALKLQNLLSAAQPGRGLQASVTDKQVVADFPETRRDELAAIVAALRGAKLMGAEASPPMDDDVEFVEGRLLTRLHFSRERSPKVRKALLAAHNDGPLTCEICAHSRPSLSRPFQECLFEAHHRLPLSAGATRRTRTSDVALLCACCHRLIHRLIARERRWVQPGEVGTLLADVAP